jgi:hypothetical protein
MSVALAAPLSSVVATTRRIVPTGAEVSRGGTLARPGSADALGPAAR